MKSFHDAPYHSQRFFNNCWGGLVTSMVGMNGPYDLRVFDGEGRIRRHNPITNGAEALEGLSESELQEALAKIEALPTYRNERHFS
jgi:hypothetical protein